MQRFVLAVGAARGCGAAVGEARGVNISKLVRAQEEFIGAISGVVAKFVGRWFGSVCRSCQSDAKIIWELVFL